MRGPLTIRQGFAPGKKTQPLSLIWAPNLKFKKSSCAAFSKKNLPKEGISCKTCCKNCAASKPGVLPLGYCSTAVAYSCTIAKPCTFNFIYHQMCPQLMFLSIWWPLPLTHHMHHIHLKITLKSETANEDVAAMVLSSYTLFPLIIVLLMKASSCFSFYFQFSTFFMLLLLHVIF